MRNTIVIALICLIFSSCGKDKFTTAPQLKYKSVNTNVVDTGMVMNLKLSFTDAEGDVDSIFIKKITPRCTATVFDVKESLPLDFKITRGTEGEFLVTYGHRVPNYPSIGDPVCGMNDTCLFRFVIKDKAKNYSDTVYSEYIVILKR